VGDRPTTPDHLPVVAFLGLGRLGGPMCRRLLEHGYDVRGYDPSELATAAVREAGAQICPTPEDAASGASVACVMVRDDDQALEVLLGPFGTQGGVIAVLAPGSIVVVHSTVSPSTVEEVHQAGAQRRIAVVDAGVSGGPDRARAGDLVAVCGGDPLALDAVAPVLACYASEVVRCGPSGAGMAAKLARNLAQYGIWCALFEGMELADRAGVDLDLFARYVRASGLPDNHDVILGRGSVEPAEPPDDAAARHLRWAVELGHKDLDDAFELADRYGGDTPIG
jgi:3-hydroxyisobutyrate dehydrogenase